MDTPHGPEVFRVWVEDEIAWLADDIRLGDIEDFTVVEEGYEPSSLEELGAPIGAGKILLGKLWPENGSGEIEIPYVMGPNCTGEQAAYAERGFQHWERWTDGFLDFQMYAYPYQGNPTDNRIFVDCTLDEACMTNFVGMKTAAPFNILYLYPCVDDWTSDEIEDVWIDPEDVPLAEHPSIAHEIGHIMGFWHEQQRQDRDDYLTWYPEATTGDFVNFATYNSSKGMDFGPFNFQSIMLYGSCALNNDPDCEIYHDGTMADDPGFNPVDDYVMPSMLAVPFSDPCYYDVVNDQRCGGIFWGDGDLLDDFPDEQNGGDLYTFARLYQKTWHISNDGRGMLSPMHFHSAWGSSVDSVHMVAGRFCDDDMSTRPNNDDILWRHQSTHHWYAVCDGGWHTWQHQEGVKILTQTDTDDILVGDFDGYKQMSDGEEWFTDIIRNEPQTQEWEWLLNGELNTGWTPVLPGANPPRTDDVGELKVGTFCFDSVEAGISDVVLKDDGEWHVSCGAVGPWTSLGASYGELGEVLIADMDGDGYSDILRNNAYGLLELALATPAPSSNTMSSFTGFTNLSIHQDSENQDLDTLKWSATDFLPGHLYIDEKAGVPDGEDLLYAVDADHSEWWVAESYYLEQHKFYWHLHNDFTSGEYPDTPMHWDNGGWGGHPSPLIGWFTTPLADGPEDEFYDDVVVTLRSVKDGEI